MSESIDVLLVCKDLLFTSQLQGAVTRAGRVGRTCLSVKGCVDQLQQLEGSVRDVVIDLELPQLDFNVIREAAGDGVRLIGFGPHVREDLFAAAGRSGCNLLLTRGQAASQLEAVLTELPGQP